MPSATQSPQSDFLPRLGAGCLILLGALLLATMVGIAVDEPGGGAGIVVMALTGIGLVGAGVFWWRFVRTSEARRRNEFEEKQVLLAAARHGGAVTIAQVALESDLTAQRADAVLARMRSRGLAHPDLLEDGTIQYRFGGLMPPGSELPGRTGTAEPS